MDFRVKYHSGKVHLEDLIQEKYHYYSIYKAY